MNEIGRSHALLRLMSWLSPAFPVGAFAYSHGIERAIHDGRIHDRASLARWLSDVVGFGSGWNDAVLLAGAWRKVDAGESWRDIAELAEAMPGSRERHMETTLQGEAFCTAVAAWSATLELPFPLLGGVRGECDAVAASLDALSDVVPDVPPPQKGEENPGTTAYPIAVAITAAAHGIALDDALIAYLHAFGSNLIQAAVRLVPLGQRDGVTALAGLEPVILETARRAAGSTLDDLGSGTFLSDIASMKHETQYSRVFRS